MSCLQGMKLSDPQRDAVLDDCCQLLVAAGAGSGKTCVLVACFVRALIDQNIPPDRLVAVTFTRKAAAELIGRIRSELEKQGRADLARSLDASAIGTIHGLCRRLIKEHALEAGVDPAAGVLEAESASLIKDELSRAVWDRVVEHAGEEQLEVFARGGDRLRRQMVPLYDRLRGMGYEAPQVRVDFAGSEDGSANGDLGMQTATVNLTNAVRAALREAAGRDKIGSALRKDIDRLEQCLVSLAGPAAPGERAAALEQTSAFFPSKSTPSMETHFEPVRVALHEYREELAALRLAPLVAGMNVLLAEFHRSYETYKVERGLLDFADLELRARLLVSGEAGAGGGLLSPGSLVLIDEFQDTNSLQYGLLSGLGASRLLLVGDERQSIYRFRGADVGVFRAREADLDKDHGPGIGRVRRLDVNYRSSAEILAFINHLFSRETFFGHRYVPLSSPVDGPDAGQACAAENEARSAPVVSSGHPAVEVVLVGRRVAPGEAGAGEKMQQAEADEIASRVRRLIDVEGRGQGEIALLLPAQTYVDLYEQALMSRGIDVYVVGGKGYYAQEEVTDVISLLRLLVNPHDDLALVAALRSPLAGLSDDALYLLGSEGRRKRGSLWEIVRDGRCRCLPPEDAERLAVFHQRLLQLRNRVGRPGLAQLIDDAVSACDYDLCLLGSAQGKRRFANVRKMMRMASDFEAVEGPDLAGFIEVLQSRDDLSDREGSAPTLAEGEDVVRIMTIHQAKGLEFPIVVLAGLGSDVHTSDAEEFMVGDDGRVGVFLRGSKRERYEDYDLSWGPAAEILEDECSKERDEDVRLLYVAMTRAEERLLLVGAQPRGDKLESCRIGRVLQALGFQALPEEGDTRLEGLDAVVTVGVAPEATQPMVPGRPPVAGRAPNAPDVLGEPVPCPRFLEPAAGDRGPRRVSFSELAAYRRCPRQYYLERVLHVELQPLPDRAPAIEAEGGDGDGAEPHHDPLDDQERRSGQDVGLLVHALLERLPATEAPPSRALLDEQADLWLQQSGTSLSGADRQRALDLTTAFWESPVAGVRATPGALTEATFLFDHAGMVVSGVMDLLLCDGSGAAWHIVDYKTNALRGRSPEEALLGYRLQADIYCLAALKCGASAVRMDFVFLERPDTPVPVEYDASALHELGATLEKALSGLRRSDFEPIRGEHCDACSVTEVCGRMASRARDGIQ